MVLWLYKQAFGNLSTEQWTGLINKFKQGCCALQRKSHLWILRKGIAYSAAGKYVDRSWKYINHTQTHECGTWDWGRAIPFLGIFVLNFRYCVFVVCSYYCLPIRALMYVLLSPDTVRLCSNWCHSILCSDVRIIVARYVGLCSYYCLPIQGADVRIIVAQYNALMFVYCRLYSVLMFVLLSPYTMRWCSYYCLPIQCADVRVIVARHSAVMFV